MRRLFGTDGIRGVVNKELTPELAFKLGRAIIGYLGDLRGKRVIIGSDTRNSKDMLKYALIAGLTSGGLNILDAGVIPTSAISYLVKTDPEVILGFMISASHNPVEYNGIKIFKNDGFKLDDKVEEILEEYISKDDKYFRAEPRDVGRVYNYEKAKEIYKRYIKNVINENFEGYKVMLDCAFGAVSEIAPEVFSELNAEVIAYNTEYNGLNINDGCGAVYPEVGKRLFENSKADIGFSYDGDADRVIAFSRGGEIVDGDKLLGILAVYLKEKGRLEGNKIVGTVMTNSGLELYLKSKGIDLIRTKVGDRYVLEEIIRNNLNLGGETSGHIILFDFLPTGDGLLTSLFILKILKELKTDLEDLSKEIPIFPQIHDKISVGSFVITHEDEEKMRKIAKEVVGEENIRYIIRKSGTEPIIRLTLEGEVPKNILENLLRDIKLRILDYLKNK